MISQLNWLTRLSYNTHAVLIGVGGVAVGFATVFGAQAMIHSGRVSPVAASEANPVSLNKITQRAASPCKQNVLTKCRDVEPGGGRIKNCVRDHWNELAPACQALIAAKHAERRSGGNLSEPNRKFACKEDARSLCADTPPGAGRIIQCLRRRSDQLSRHCRRIIEGRAQNSFGRPRI